LFGIRIDICARGGKFVKPYYLLLKRVGENKKFLQVYRHTIPIFIPLSQLEERYLPAAQGDNEGGDNLKSRKPKRQDLRRLVQELRRELVAYHLRCDSLAWLREELRILEDSELDGDNAATGTRDGSQQSPNQFGIISVAATSLETRYIRLEWQDGRVGRIKLSNRGIVERAIVIGDDGRDKSMENVLSGGNGRIEDLIQRLRAANSSLFV
jgi:central kinetochore subunit Mal2/MCM21